MGFGLLGYCPGTAAGAVGQGSWDALFGGVGGMLLGAGLLAAVYPRLARGILSWKDFGELTLPQWLKVNPWVVIIPVVVVLIAVLVGIEKAGW